MIALSTFFRKKLPAIKAATSDRSHHHSKNDFCRFTDSGSRKPLIDSDHKSILFKLKISVHLKKRTTSRQIIAKLDQNSLNDQNVKRLFCQSTYKYYVNHVGNTDRLINFQFLWIRLPITCFQRGIVLNRMVHGRYQPSAKTH